MELSNIKTCLVITYGPVPTPQYQTVEGGGMRAWGLAAGLAANGIKVTVAVNSSFPQELKKHANVILTNWSLDEHFIDLINSYDAVLVSYCMGDPSVFVVDNISDEVQLILDAYVPIYVEVSARESDDMEFEYTHYMSDIKNYNYVLKRGDYFLCANNVQKTFYVGVLSGLGIINPRSYRQNRILVVPFGIHDTPIETSSNPYDKLGFEKSDFVVLWFGGLYPWFKIQDLLDAILDLSKIDNMKFVIVGGKNPFNTNVNFVKQYDKAHEFAQAKKLLNKSLFFVDWVNFDDRINWYVNADVVISINKPGEENGFAWRTRVMDYIWGGMAILTNGGDPLSEELIEKNAALRLKELSAQEISSKLTELYNDRKALDEIRKSIKLIKPGYFWHYITKPIVDILEAADKPYKDESSYRKKLKLSPVFGTESKLSKLTKASKIIRLPQRVISYGRRKGLRRSIKLAKDITATQLKNRIYTDRRFVFISHPIDNTGAPLVLLDIIDEFVHKYGAKSVCVVTPHITPPQLRKLRESGVKVNKAALGLGKRLLALQLGLRKNDFVMMNTAAVYNNYRDFVLSGLRSGKIDHAYWFIHEDKEQLPHVNDEFLQARNIKRVGNLVNANKLTVLVPTKRTKEEYDEILKTEKVKIAPLKVRIDGKYRKIKRTAKDFDSVNFLLSGTPIDGRKGQMIAISAFYNFLAKYQSKNPSQYRDFTLQLVSVGKDYASQQIKWIGNSLLGERVKIHPHVTRSEAMDITARCNAVICCSLNETFGLYIAEGMFMGHFILRNNSAGVDEQLQEGKNGYAIDITDINQISSVIERVLNKSKTSSVQLKNMGLQSQRIIGPYAENMYMQHFNVD